MFRLMNYSVHDYYLQDDTELHGCAKEWRRHGVVEGLGDIPLYRLVSTFQVFCLSFGIEYVSSSKPNSEYSERSLPFAIGYVSSPKSNTEY
jgi:hypothetical protein